MLYIFISIFFNKFLTCTMDVAFAFEKEQKVLCRYRRVARSEKTKVKCVSYLPPPIKRAETVKPHESDA